MTARRQPSPDDGQAGSEDIHMAPVNNNNAAEKTSISRPAEADSDISVFSDTLFIGGGTPSSVPPPLIEELMAFIRKSKGAVFSGRDENVSRDETEERAHRGQTKVSSLLAEDAEVTIEVNPGTVDYEGLLSYRRAGINRLSMGVQSFCDEELRFLGRIHSAEDAERCFHDARKAGFDNINIDLIFGFPGNTVKSWRKTLKTALDLRPDHISFYSLQIEEGTPLYRMFRNDEVEQVSDEINRQMYHDAVRLLQENGYLHYEISNASLPGKQCRHNLKYWSMCDYVGFGVSAHSYLREHAHEIFSDYEGKSGDARKGAAKKDARHTLCGVRYYNEDEISGYIARIKGNRGGYIPLGACKNSLTDEISESIFTALRKTEGLDIKWFDERFAEDGITFLERYGDKIEPFLRDGFLVLKDHHLSFTLKGFDISNYILSELI